MTSIDRLLLSKRKIEKVNLQTCPFQPLTDTFKKPKTLETKKKNKICGIELYPKKPQPTSTITQYFTPLIKPIEDETVVCTVRHKVPLLDLWHTIQLEFTPDPFYFEYLKEKKQVVRQPKRKRPHELNPLSSSKKKPTLDHDLSDFMKRFLNIQTKSITFEPIQEEEENLSRQIKTKLTIQQSSLLFAQITEEFLF